MQIICKQTFFICAYFDLLAVDLYCGVYNIRLPTVEFGTTTDTYIADW